MPGKADVIVKGREQQPIVIVDDFFPLPDKLLADASARDYSTIGPYYPGIRANVPAWYTNFLLQSLDDVIRKVFGYDRTPVVEEGMYSLVTTRPEDLAPIQRLPHYDGVEPDKLAVLHYLCDEHMGGTSFYRHRSTGYETVTAERFERFRESLESEAKAEGLPEARYIDGSTSQFEQIERIAARFNRLVIYRGINLHCAAVSNNAKLPPVPRGGRLTVNTFLRSDRPAS